MINFTDLDTPEPVPGILKELIICNACGIVLHKEKVTDYLVNEETGNKYAYIQCPLCHNTEKVGHDR